MHYYIIENRINIGSIYQNWGNVSYRASSSLPCYVFYAEKGDEKKLPPSSLKNAGELNSIFVI